MMATETISHLSECGDAELVSQIRAGNRDAFGQIVVRYQTLICSLTYNATGSLSQSQDVAQETFVTAWKQIGNLREPNRLRSWLCGIARNLSHNALRQHLREPANTSEPLEAARAVASPDLLPSDQAISREEEVILWRALEGIPSAYREPLILFYREHQSVEQVARALELSPDAVKQRLARGRKMLHEKVTAFVEGALQRTSPGTAFTLGVLAALPLVAASSAAAATIGGTAAKVGIGAKAAAVGGLIGATLGPIIGILGSIGGAWASIANTRSPRERQFMIRQTGMAGAYVLLFLVAMFALILYGRGLASLSPGLFGIAIGVLTAAYVAGLVSLALRGNRRQRQIQVEDGTAEIMPALQPRPPSRGQRLWHVYGCLGGSTFGVLAWIIVQAVHADAWPTAAVTALFGVAVVLAGGRTWMRDPEKRLRVMFQTVVLLGLFTVGTAALHWHDWAKAADAQTTAVQGILIGSGLTVAAIAIAAFLRFRRHGPRSGNQTHSHNNLVLIALVLSLLSVISRERAGAGNPRTESKTLPNGIRIAFVHFPASTNMGIATYLRMGLVMDGPQQAK